MNNNREKLATIDKVIDYLRVGRMIILVDDEDRENEGDLCAVAEKVTPEIINFMAKHARGLICLALTPEIASSLELEPMTLNNTSPLGTAFTVSIDAKEGITTGISAKERALTILKTMEDGAGRKDFTSPGHIFPLIARKGGVLVRAGQTEGGVDLALLAGFKGGAVICEIMDNDGTMMRMPKLLKFGKKYDIPVYTIADLIRYKLLTEIYVKKVAEVSLESEFGKFSLHTFKNEIDSMIHLALVKGNIKKDDGVLVRVHRSNLLNDVFHFAGTSEKISIELALKMIEKEGKGVFLYLSKEEKGVDLVDNLVKLSRNGNIENGLKNYIHSQQKITFREFGIGAQILRQLGLKKIRVITNHPKKFVGLQGFGLEIVEWVKLIAGGKNGKC